MIFHKGDFYPRRDGSPSPYVIGQFKDMTDLNVVIPLLKSLDYPFIADNWYIYFDMDLNPINPVGKYIGKMNLAAYKASRFEDSKHFNQYSQNLKRLYREIDRTLYDEVVDVLPKPEIKTEEIKSNTFKKPKYLIAYDENGNPTAKFKYIKDMNITFDYNTTSTQDALGHMVFSWTSDKVLNTNFTCSEVELLPPEDKPQNVIVNGHSNNVPKVEEEKDLFKEIDDFINSLKGEWR